ncbi:MAG: ATP-binding protein [Acidobacteriota bacterium]|nr:ATP-binding protein [Acidobacteriota bacterium]
MRGPSVIQIALLSATAVGAIWMASIAFHRKHVPGGRAFGGLNLSIAWWAIFSAIHALQPPVESQILITKIHYAGILAVPPCWLLFTADYVRVGWARRNALRRGALWVLPIVFLLMVATNDSHHLYFTSIARVDGVTVYRWGPLFWAAAFHSYALMLAGTVILLRGLRLFPRPYRGQTIALVAAAVIPWIGNAAYLGGVARPGFDPTPVLFAVSNALIFMGLYTLRLFDVVPTARAAVFDGLTDAVFVLDRAHRVVDANPAAVALVDGVRGRTSDLQAVIGRHPLELMSWWRELPSPPAPSDTEPHLVTIGDRVFEMQASTFAHARGGTLLRLHDITSRRKTEVERLGLESRLREQERIESLTVMAAGLAHDFNNLLTAILGNADYLVATSPEDSERKSSAQAIASAAQHAADLITQIVAFSGQGRTFMSHVSLEDAVGDVLRALTRTLGERALITHESHPDLPLVPADLVQIRQAVLALLTNAVGAVASTHGSVEVLTGRETLDAAALRDMNYSAAFGPGEFVFVDVKDDGPGIPPDVLPRIFEPFFSTHDAGRGLGLAAVHGIVRGHSGAIRIWTAPGAGTRVRIWWPL